MAGEAGDQELAADGVGGLAVHAGAGLGAGGGEAEALGVGGSGHIARPLHGAVHIVADLVNAHDQNDLLRPVGDGGDPVGVAVDVHQHAVLGDGVGAGEEHVRVIGQQHGRPLVLVGVPVDELVVALLQRVHQADLVNADAAAHGGGAALRNQLQRQPERLLPALGVVAGHVAGLEPFDDLLRQQRVAFYHVCIHADASFFAYTGIIPNYFSGGNANFILLFIRWKKRREQDGRQIRAPEKQFTFYSHNSCDAILFVIRYKMVNLGE